MTLSSSTSRRRRVRIAREPLRRTHGRFRRLAAVTVLVPLFPCAGALAGETAEELTADTLLQKHLEAHGGAERLRAIRSLKIEGTWSAFSIDVPMTIRRMRPDLYRFDHILIDAPAVLAYDGKKPWLQSAVFGAPDGRELTESWKRNVVEDARFGCALLDHATSGAAVEFLGPDKVEGQDVYAFRVARGDAPEETWYLDAGTLLETKRVSRTFDVFSGPDAEFEMETFFMDFREVGGVMFAHREERHFGTRYHVYEAAAIEVNPEIDAGVFRMPEKKKEGDSPAPDGSPHS